MFLPLPPLLLFPPPPPPSESCRRPAAPVVVAADVAVLRGVETTCAEPGSFVLWPAALPAVVVVGATVVAVLPPRLCAESAAVVTVRV